MDAKTTWTLKIRGASDGWKKGQEDSGRSRMKVRVALVKCPFPPEMGLDASWLGGVPLLLEIKQKRV